MAENRKTLRAAAALLLITVLFAAVASLAACNNGGEPKTDSAGRINNLVVGTTDAVNKATRDEYNYNVLTAGITQLPLVGMTDEGEYYPVAAEYSVSDDNRVWTYTVRDGLTWHDGTAVTAYDILATLYYCERDIGVALLNDRTGADGTVQPARYESYAIGADGRSISLTLSEPNAVDIKNMMTYRLVPAAVYTTDPDRTIEDDLGVSDEQGRMGCGPFEFESFNKAAGTLTFISYDDYFGGAPNVKRITFRLFGNDDTMNMALARGDLDLIWKYSGGVSAAGADYLSKAGGVTLMPVAVKKNPAVLMFNTSREPFNDVNLRLAVRSALDYDKFRSLFASRSSVSVRAGVVPSVVQGYVETQTLTRDIAAAEKYLAAAGYTDADINSEGYHTKNGETLGFRLTYQSAKAEQQRYAELIRSNLKEIGIKVELDGCETAVFKEKTMANGTGNVPTHQACITAFTAAGMDMMGGIASIYVYGNHPMQGGAQVFDPVFEEIYYDLQTAATLDEYADAAARCQRYYAENAPVVALFMDSVVHAHSSHLSGLKADANFGLLNVMTWASVKWTE